jgi:hypothetical protein
MLRHQDVVVLISVLICLLDITSEPFSQIASKRIRAKAQLTL